MVALQRPISKLVICHASIFWGHPQSAILIGYPYQNFSILINLRRWDFGSEAPLGGASIRTGLSFWKSCKICSAQMPKSYFTPKTLLIWLGLSFRAFVIDKAKEKSIYKFEIGIFNIFQLEIWKFSKTFRRRRRVLLDSASASRGSQKASPPEAPPPPPPHPHPW